MTRGPKDRSRQRRKFFLATERCRLRVPRNLEALAALSARSLAGRGTRGLKMGGTRNVAAYHGNFRRCCSVADFRRGAVRFGQRSPIFTIAIFFSAEVFRSWFASGQSRCEI